MIKNMICPVLKRFLCYFGLRGGCVIIGVICMFERLIFGLGDAIVFISHKAIFDEVDVYNTVHISLCMANGLLGITSAATLVHGAFESNRNAIKMYLGMAVVLIILIFISVVLGVAALKSSKLSDVYRLNKCDENCQWGVNISTYVLVFDVFDLVTYVYYWICAGSFYYELKSMNQSVTKSLDQTSVPFFP